MLAKVEKLPNRKVLLQEPTATLVIDVSEQPIERPVKNQKADYSGKKRHTIKSQIVICLLTLTILSVGVGKGRQHDFSVFKSSRLLLHPDAVLLADLGYQGMHKHHPNSTLPIKMKKANYSRQRTKPIIRHYRNSAFSLNMSTAHAKFSRLLRIFIGASTRITR